MKTLTRKFQNAGLGQNSLTYTANGSQHIVTHRLNAGETVGNVPEVYRHTTIEAARQTWARLTKVLTARGYAAV